MFIVHYSKEDSKIANVLSMTGMTHISHCFLYLRASPSSHTDCPPKSEEVQVPQSPLSDQSSDSRWSKNVLLDFLMF